jgi:hypothetical protein
MRNRGSALVLMMFLTVAVLIVTRLVMDGLGGWLASQKAQTAADFALLSALRVRAESLETVAARWDTWGASLTVAGGELEAPAAQLPAVTAEAGALQRALSGYQGRITSALTVAAEANGADRAQVTLTDSSGLRLGLTSEAALLSSPGLTPVLVDGLWYRRNWTNADAAGTASVSVAWDVPRAGGVWTLSAPAVARLLWDADTGDAAIAADGNGGFASDWVSASAAGPAFRPNRAAVFRAEPGGLP